MKRFSATRSLLMLLPCFLFQGAAAESPYLYGIHDHAPEPTEYLNRIKAAAGGGWVTATVEVGANPNNVSGDNFSSIANQGHTVICRINYGYFPNGTIPPRAKWDDFAQRCANYVANSQGCSIWMIANETNLAAEWPLEDGRFNYVSPQDYAELFRKVYNAIKAVRPNDKVLPQPLAPWAGPYGPGTLNGYPHDPMPLNWVQYLNQMLTAIAATGPLDGIALHINSRGYSYEDIHSTHKVNANGQNLYFSFYVYKDWVDLGIPPSLYHLPLYATECNGYYFWKGGHPEAPGKTYEAGWMQEIYAEIHRYNQAAAISGKPIFRCINMYRWCNGCDGWNIDGSPQKTQILSDLDAAAAQRYAWPAPASAAPVLAPPPARTIDELDTLTFSFFASDPQPGQIFSNFESSPHGTSQVMFRHPRFSPTTTAFLDASPNSAAVTTNFPGGNPSSSVLHVNCSFIPGTANPWLRLTTFGGTTVPNPTISFTGAIKFDVYADREIGIAVGLRETSTTAAIGADGGTSGPIEFAGASQVIGVAPVPVRIVPAGTWTTIQFNLPSEEIRSFTGNGMLESSTGKGVIEHLAITPAGGAGVYNIYLDNFAVLSASVFSYSLSNAPAGASVNPANGVFTWTPSEAQGPGTYEFTARVMKNSDSTLSDSKSVAVLVSEVNTAPVLSTVPNQIVNAGSTLVFTNTATDADLPANALVFSLDSGLAGAHIDPATGVFTWSAPNVTGPMTNTVTIRVTDDGQPPLAALTSFNAIVVPPPRLSSAAVHNAEVILAWTAFPGKSYRVQFKNDLDDPQWSNIGDATIAGSDALSISLPAADARKFYRILQLD